MDVEHGVHHGKNCPFEEKEEKENVTDVRFDIASHGNIHFSLS